MNIDALKKLGDIVHFETDEQVFMQGETGDSLFILLRGHILIYITSEFDGGIVELITLNEGALFGEMSIITNEKRSASAKALSDAFALRIGKDNFEKFITLEPRFAVNMMKTLSSRYFETFEKIEASRGEHDGSLC